MFLSDTRFIENCELMLAPKNMNNLIGLNFIKHFNWILDYKNKAVYIKSRTTNIADKEFFYRDSVGASFNFSNNPMTISTMVINGLAEKSGLLVNDEILSINKYNISKIPPCERKERIKNIIERCDTLEVRIKRQNDILIKKLKNFILTLITII